MMPAWFATLIWCLRQGVAAMVRSGGPRHGYNTTLGSGALEPLAKSQATNHFGNSSVGKL
jgi:hypothetical protein